MAEWVEDLHPRVPKGQPGGGQWAEKGGAGGWSIDDDDRDEIAQYQPAASRLESDTSGWSTGEKQAIRDYQLGAAYELNKSLRTGEFEVQGELRLIQPELDNLIRRSRLSENVVLYRYLDDVTLFDDLKPGDALVDKGYMSTAMGIYHDPRKTLKILAPKGSQAIVAPALSEVILARNSRLEYIGEDPADGSKYFRLQQEGGERPAEDEIPKVPPREADDAGGLRQHLQVIAGFNKDQFPGAKDPATYMLEHGQSFQFDESSYKGKHGRVHQCYANAGREAIDDPDVTYVEGYVSVHGVPLEHAWLVDKKGHVIDPTIKNSKGISGYFGIPIKSEYLRKTILRTKKWGVLDWMNIQKVLKDDPKDIVADYTQGGGWRTS